MTNNKFMNEFVYKLVQFLTKQNKPKVMHIIGFNPIQQGL